MATTAATSHLYTYQGTNRQGQVTQTTDAIDVAVVDERRREECMQTVDILLAAALALPGDLGGRSIRMQKHGRRSV